MNTVRISCAALAAAVALAVSLAAAQEKPAPATAGQGAPAAGVKEMKGETCPVLGGKIDKSISCDYKGTRYYFCCVGCQGKFKADPEKYIAKMPKE